MPHRLQPLSKRQFMHHAVHLVLTWVMLWLTYIFLDNTDTFSTSIAFSVMAETMTEQHWGILTGAVASVGLITTFVDDWRWRVLAAGVLAFGHLVVAIMIYLGNKHGTGTGPYAGFAALGCALAYSTAHVGLRAAPYMGFVDPSG